MPLITLELTEDEQISLLGFLVNNTKQLLATGGDPNNWLEDLERVEEKIRDAQEDMSIAIDRAIIYDERSA